MTPTTALRSAPHPNASRVPAVLIWTDYIPADWDEHFRLGEDVRLLLAFAGVRYQPQPWKEISETAEYGYENVCSSDIQELVTVDV